MASKVKKKPQLKSRASIPIRKELPPDFNAEMFVTTWNFSSTLQSFSATYEIAASTASLYAARLREAGYNLKKFRKGRPRRFQI